MSGSCWRLQKLTSWPSRLKTFFSGAFSATVFVCAPFLKGTFSAPLAPKLSDFSGQGRGWPPNPPPPRPRAQTHPPSSAPMRPCEQHVHRGSAPGHRAVRVGLAGARQRRMRSEHWSQRTAESRMVRREAMGGPSQKGLWWGWPHGTPGSANPGTPPPLPPGGPVGHDGALWPRPLRHLFPSVGTPRRQGLCSHFTSSPFSGVPDEAEASAVNIWWMICGVTPSPPPALLLPLPQYANGHSNGQSNTQ